MAWPDDGTRGATTKRSRESFDEFRSNLFPSHETFWNVAGTGEEAGIVHRTAGLAYLYTLITLPVINEYGYE